MFELLLCHSPEIVLAVVSHQLPARGDEFSSWPLDGCCTWVHWKLSSFFKPSVLLTPSRCHFLINHILGAFLLSLLLLTLPLARPKTTVAHLLLAFGVYFFPRWSYPLSCFWLEVCSPQSETLKAKWFQNPEFFRFGAGNREHILKIIYWSQ